jgi:hypothetical protein
MKRDARKIATRIRTAEEKEFEAKPNIFAIQ